MTKTIELQVEKCRTLIDGLRKHMCEVAPKGVKAEELDRLEQNLQKLAAASDECEALRATLSEKVKAMNNILIDVKETFAANKRIVKNNYAQEQWARYGVMDKR